MKLLFLGDFFNDMLDCPEDLNRICEYFQRNKYYVVLNLEGTLSDKGYPVKKRGPNLLSSPNTIDILKALNVFAVCMANNHSMDYGDKSLIESIEMLERAGIHPIGAGKRLRQALKPLVLEERKKKVVLTNYGWNIEETVYAKTDSAGCAPLDRQMILREIRTIKQRYPESFLINLFHWGFEYNTFPMPLDIQFAHDCLDEGSNLVIGHHPHVLQPKEKWNGKRVYYSLGNFFFGNMRKTFNKKFPLEREQRYADLGIGVLFDTKTEEIQEIGIRYIPDINKTEIDFDLPDMMDDITGIDWKSQEYSKNVKLHALNYNPVLGLNEEENKTAIKHLYWTYWLAERTKFVRKTKIGEKIAQRIKGEMIG